MTDAIGMIPYRMAFAGGWIDQPFVSAVNPDSFGSMVVVSIQPQFRLMDRCGMATSSRKVAQRIWNGKIPDEDYGRLTRELYNEENKDLPAPSGSQDMVGIIYPGISRLDYSIEHEGGYFPFHIESNTGQETAEWLERNISLVPVAQRPAGYNPLETRNLEPEDVRRLGQTGRDCFDAIINMDSKALGASMNTCMECWEKILPGTVLHHTLKVDLKKVMRHYQERYDGAMYSGCGGGYLYVVSEQDVPGGIRIKVRL